MIPPEAFRGDQFSRAFDIYQVGLTLYRMANGDLSFYEQYDQYTLPESLLAPSGFDRDKFKYDVMNERFPSRHAYLEHIPSKLRAVITKCLRADPDQRYRSAIEVVNDLADIGGEELGWRYQEDVSAGRRWVKDKSGTLYSLALNASGVATADKKTGSGRYTKILSHCKSALSEREIKTFLKTY